MAKTWKTFAGAISRSAGVIFAWDENSRERGEFDAADGTRVSGDLEMPADDVLFLAWRQRQSPSLSDASLRSKWEDSKKEQG